MAKVRPSNPPHPRLSEEEMRRRFNDGGYWRRLQQGEFTEHIISETSEIEFPEILERFPDARSRMTHYRNAASRTIVEVHYYIERPGGPIIEGMRPDPKLLFEDGMLYHKEKLRNRLRRLEQEARAAEQGDPMQ
jgi:hypothetical protein